MSDDLTMRLLDRAEALTLKRLKREGELMPGALLCAKGRGSVVVELPWRSADEKVALLDLLKAWMATASVDAYAIWAEAWLSIRKTESESVDIGAAMNPEVMPSQDPDRIDAVVIVAALKGKQAAARLWEIKKDAKGRVTRLEPVNGGDTGMFGAGRLGELLDGPAFDA